MKNEPKFDLILEDLTAWYGGVLTEENHESLLGEIENLGRFVLEAFEQR